MRLLVIGGVAAGLSAASRARRIDRRLEIVVLERGEAVSWAACGLPYYIEGQVRDLDELILHTSEYFASQRGIQVRTGAEVAHIHHARREVTLTGGERVSYDRLVVATGARAGRLPGGGAAAPPVFTLQTLDEARRLKRFLEQGKPRRAAVIGASYIGLEAAGALRARGLSVTVLEAAPDVLGRHDPELTRRLARHLERHGVELRCQTPVQDVGSLGCDLAVVATGMAPNVELAAEAGAELGPTGAIRVDQHMETSLAEVWAAGDCAETTHLVTGRPAWIPLGSTANKMGRVAGANAAGARQRLAGVVGTSIVRVCGLAFAFTGLSAPDARQAGFEAVNARIEAADRAPYFWASPTSVELVADRRTGRLLGGAVTGEHGAAGRINVIAAAVTRRMTVDEFQELDLAYAPPYAPVWDPVLVAAQQLAKLLD